LVQFSSLQRLPPPCATQWGVPPLTALLVQPSRSHSFRGIATVHPLACLKMGVIKTRTSAGEGATVVHGSPHILTHPYTMRVPCAHGASPEGRKPQEQHRVYPSLLLGGDPSNESSKEHFTHANGPLGMFYTAQTRTRAAYLQRASPCWVGCALRHPPPKNSTTAKTLKERSEMRGTSCSRMGGVKKHCCC